LGGANRQALAALKQCKHNGFPVIRVMDSVDEEEATGRSIRRDPPIPLPCHSPVSAWHGTGVIKPCRLGVL
jgi:hypothetical protein